MEISLAENRIKKHDGEGSTELPTPQHGKGTQMDKMTLIKTFGLVLSVERTKSMR